MTIKDILIMFNIDESKIVRNKENQDKSLVFSGIYDGKSIDIIDKEDYFVFAGSEQLFKINKKTGEKEPYKITVH